MSADRGPESPAGIAEFRDTLRALEDRVAVLEGLLAAPAGPAADPTEDEASLSVPAPTGSLTFGQGFGLVGRAVLLLAGAFLLRSLTETGVIPPEPGFGLGLTYSLLLVFLSDRSAGRGYRPAAVATGLAALVVAFPFVYETTAGRAIVPVGAGAASLATLAGATLFVAVRRDLKILYWAAGLATLGTTLALYFATGHALLFASLLLALGAATVIIGYLRPWYMLRWPASIVVDAVVLHLTLTAVNPDGAYIAGRPVAGGGIQMLALALLLVYLGLFTARALVQGRGVRPFDVIQSGLVIAIGFGLGTQLALFLDRGPTLLGWGAMFTALAGYATAFTVVRQRHGRGRAFFYFATLALLFLVLGSRLVLASGLLVWAWIALAVGAAWLGGRFRRSTLRIHSAVYLFLAFVQTGLPGAIRDAFVGSPASVWRDPGYSGVVALVATVACYGILLVSRDPAASRKRRLPRLLVGILLLAGLGWASVALLVRLVTAAPPEAGPAVTAVVRTAVLALTAVVLARASRRPAFTELAWLVYPVLVIGLGKLLLEDLKVGDPIALTISFGLFGAALVMAPRLMRRQEGDGEPGPADS